MPRAKQTPPSETGEDLIIANEPETAPEPEEPELVEAIPGLLWRAISEGDFEEQIACRDDSAYELSTLRMRAVSAVDRAFKTFKAEEFPKFSPQNRLCVRIWVE